LLFFIAEVIPGVCIVSIPFCYDIICMGCYLPVTCIFM